LSRAVSALDAVAVGRGYRGGVPAAGDPELDRPELLRQHVEAPALPVGRVVTRQAIAARRTSMLAALELGRLATAVDQAADANPALSRITGIPAPEAMGHRCRPS
jgi:hypothetical protein